MSEIYEQLEIDFEGEKEMEETKVIELKETQEVVGAPEATEQEPKVQAQVVISVFEDGRLDVSSPEGMRQLQSGDVEALTRQVYEQLRDMRIAQAALEIFKARLS
jgi:hypothetical protein